MFKELCRGKENGDKIIYGEYPQYRADDNTQLLLEKAYQHGALKKTGRSYTLDSNKSMTPVFEPIAYDEYEFENEGYIRVTYISPISKEINVWIKVSPIEWLVDIKNKRLISKRCLFSGIRYFEHSILMNDYTFRDTKVQEFMNEYMLRDMHN